MHFLIVGLDVLFDMVSMIGFCQKFGCCQPSGERLECCCLDKEGKPSGDVLMECLYEGPCGRFLKKGGDDEKAGKQEEDKQVEL